jgi:hypothetical protein
LLAIPTSPAFERIKLTPETLGYFEYFYAKNGHLGVFTNGFECRIFVF